MKANPGVALITLRVEEKILQDFRMAVSRKHKGVTRGTTFVEFNNALSTWTKVLNGEAEVSFHPKKIRSPVFEPSKEES